MTSWATKAAATTAAMAAVLVTAPAPALAETTYAVSSKIPASCYGRMQTSDANGNTGQVFMSERRISHETDRGGFPYTPTNAVAYGSAGGEGSFVNSWWAVAADGSLHDTTLYTVEGASRDTVTTHHDEVIAQTYKTVEDMALTYADGFRLFRLTEDGGMYRNTMDYGKVGTTKTVFSRGGTGIRSIDVTRQITWKGEPADVILANTTANELREYIIPVNDPTNWTIKVLTTSSWGAFSELRSFECGTKGRLIIGRNDNGRIGLWYDPNATDFDASDFASTYTSLPALPATTKTL